MENENPTPQPGNPAGDSPGGTPEPGSNNTITPEQRAEIARAFVKEQGFGDDWEIPVSVNGELKHRPGKEAKADMSGTMHRNALYEQFQNEKKQWEQEKAALERQHESKEAYLKKWQAELTQGVQPQPESKEDPFFEKASNTFDAPPDEIIQKFRERGKFMTIDEAKDFAEKLVKQEIDKFSKEKVDPVLAERQRENDQRMIARVQGAIFSKVPYLNPESDEFKQRPALYSGMYNSIFNELGEFAQNLDDVKHGRAALKPKFAGYNDLYDLIEDHRKAYEKDIESVRVADREEQQKVNSGAAPHDPERIKTILSEMPEDGPFDYDDFFKRAGVM